uniref:Ig-like domain-containing protein n=1 Tax=Anopheles melas TaxID=34690 RepID=A0A182U371_9DIPT
MVDIQPNRHLFAQTATTTIPWGDTMHLLTHPEPEPTLDNMDHMDMGAATGMTFIADERFQSFYVESSGVWTLQIKYVQARDAGIYECQVSTEPKISARVHLHVVD